MPLTKLIPGLGRRRAVRQAVHDAYGTIVARARMPEFYRDRGVPDTLDGRFELIALHMFLVLRRLRAEPEAQRFGQALFDLLFADMDRSLRELGSGDLSVGKQVKRMAQSLYGRIEAYGGTLLDTPALEEALKRNLFGTVEDPAAEHIAFAAAYLQRQAAVLAAEPVAAITAGRIAFAPLEA